MPSSGYPVIWCCDERTRGSAEFHRRGHRECELRGRESPDRCGSGAPVHLRRIRRECLRSCTDLPHLHRSQPARCGRGASCAGSAFRCEVTRADSGPDRNRVRNHRGRGPGGESRVAERTLGRCRCGGPVVGRRIDRRGGGDVLVACIVGEVGARRRAEHRWRGTDLGHHRRRGGVLPGTQRQGRPHRAPVGRNHRDDRRSALPASHSPDRVRSGDQEEAGRHSRPRCGLDPIGRTPGFGSS